MFLFSISLAAAPIPAVTAAYQIQPTEGRDTIAPAPPTYCDLEFKPALATYGTELKLQQTLDLDAYVANGTIEKPIYRLISESQQAASMVCTWKDDPNAHAWMASYKQAYHNILGVPGDVLDDLFAQAIKGRYRGDLGKKIDAADPPCGIATDEFDDQRTKTHKAAIRALVCGAGTHSEHPAWWLDRKVDLENDVERGILIEALLHTGYANDGERLTKWLFMRHDAAAYDPAGVGPVLKEMEVPEPMYTIGRIRAYHVDLKLTEARADWAKRAKKLPEILDFEKTADEAYASWTRDYETHKAGYDDVFAIEDAWLSGRKKNLEGCSEKLWAHYDAYAKTVAPKTTQAYEEMTSHAYPAALLAAIARCELTVGSVGRSIIAEHFLGLSAHQRGPRTASVVATLPAVHRAKEDFERFPYAVQDMLPYGYRGRLTPPQDTMAAREELGSHSIGQGIVSKIEADGDLNMKISFKTEKWMEPTWHCTSTNRISRINADGSVDYEENCKITGSAQVSHTPDPAIVDKRFIGAAKVGRYVKAIGFDAHNRVKREGAGESGFVSEVFATPKSTTPLSVYDYVP